MLSIEYSNIEGGWEGIGNINADPLFNDIENEDYTLQATSPCIDAGNPNSSLDLDGTPADMGAYSFFLRICSLSAKFPQGKHFEGTHKYT